MVSRTIEYVFQQVMWLISNAAQLIAAMGVGIKWMFMTLRCATFSMLNVVYFMPNIVWYLLTPNVIRRVSYRSSRTTKIRNLEALLSKQVLQDGPASLASLGSFSWRPFNSRRGAHPEAGRGIGHAGGTGVRSSPRHLGNGPEGVDRGAVERWASSINPADGTFVNGLPVNIADEDGSPAASRPKTALNFNNSFVDTVEALRRMYEHRSQKRQKPEEGNEAHQSSFARCSSPTMVHDSFTDSDNDEDVEDRMNLHNRAMLDIYLPVPLDSLFRFMDQERKSSEATHMKSGGKRMNGESHYCPKLQRKRFPILISINGGAWIIGCYLWNFLVARLFAARGYVVFCPDYRNFPQTTMEGMTLDISDAIAWVLNNAERYNGDLSNVTLIGQSAGAHLTMMSLLSQAQLSAYQYNAEQGIHQGVPPPSDVAYNVPRYNPRESIHRYVGLSGIFNVAHLVKHFDKRGLYRGVLYQIAGGKEQMTRYTLSAYFDDRLSGDTGEVLPDNIFDFLPQRMFFMHGDADKSAPATESASIVYLMRNAQRDAIVRLIRNNPEAAVTLPKPATIEFILVPGATHTDAIIEEPLCGNSHIVEFLLYYDIDDDERRQAQLQGRTQAPVSTNKDGQAVMTDLAHSRTSSTGTSSAAGGVSPDPLHILPSFCPIRPDGILLSPCPSSTRPRLMRLASYICPF
ncbi:hypothetical protein JKF63_06075 [Porcisia hertigi]|uniref:BD-FAE-like domain-containing protein n=1 Tax=Porcisia hertigi TaxID=2761500 RepID=A0A836I0C9_9TRYP|nr:hypothetical protein JKF63_06075 [Porcisia hertigi]